MHNGECLLAYIIHLFIISECCESNDQNWTKNYFFTLWAPGPTVFLSAMHFVH